MSTATMTVWNAPHEPAAMLVKMENPTDLLPHSSPHLTARDQKSIISALEQGSFEMMATFVWAKTSSVLKKQISTLGMEFVGEMLGRPDLDDDSDPATAVADHEAISLAEDLGLVTATQGLRLKHAMELVIHFTNLEQAEAEGEAMSHEEALGLLRTCVASILSQPTFEGAVKFADFRRALGERTLKADDGEVLAITSAQYFFLRTTLSVLLSMIKTSTGAGKEHALGNFSLLLPKLWPHLRAPEKWQVGQAYAEVNARGDLSASSGIKRALIKVHGFDFVPENLRSNTFSETAARVLSAHFGFNNFHNEQEPMKDLADLGTAIPKPAFGKCMEATLAVWLGNSWGRSWEAQSAAAHVLDSLRKEQWEYYFNECMRRDRTTLDKLAQTGKPLARWKELAIKYDLNELTVHMPQIARLLQSSKELPDGKLAAMAQKIREQATS